ncbi:hypothetical protein JD969_10055 [Planctomycetota bacterium]|nr:hypothetical protein JD969_10055 [Planctomycetota bacterium]
MDQHEEQPLPPPTLKPPAYCLGCNYNLAHLSTTTCPECGRSFDPTDYQTYNEYNPHRDTHYNRQFFFILSISIFFFILPYPGLNTLIQFLIYPTAHTLAKKAYKDPTCKLKYFAFLPPILIALFATRDFIWLYQYLMSN